MAIFKFTEARIRDLALGSGIHRDTDVKGLLCICHKTTKTFACQGDVRREKRLVRTVRVKIGRTDLVRLADARSEAKRLMATIQSGVDPTAGPASTGITLEQTLVEHLKERSLSAATVRGYQYHMDHYLKGLRKRAVADISRQDCRDLLDTLTRRHGKTTGGSVMRTVRALVNTARRHDETITANPVDAIRVPATPKRQVGELDVAAFSGQDLQNIERKYKDDFIGYLHVQWLLMSNEPVLMQDLTGTIATRMVSLETRKSFLGKEDPDLFERDLRPEASGVLNRCLEGARRLAESGRFTAPRSMDGRKKEILREASTVAAFASERLVPDKAASVTKQEVYDAYQAYCRGHGRTATDQNIFWRDLRASGKFNDAMLKRPSQEGQVRVYVVKGLRVELDADALPFGPGDDFDD